MKVFGGEKEPASIRTVEVLKSTVLITGPYKTTRLQHTATPFYHINSELLHKRHKHIPNMSQYDTISKMWQQKKITTNEKLGNGNFLSNVIHTTFISFKLNYINHHTLFPLFSLFLRTNVNGNNPISVNTQQSGRQISSEIRNQHLLGPKTSKRCFWSSSL